MIEVRPITPERWDDLVSLFGPNGAYSNCWCTYWTWRTAEWERRTPKQRRAELRRQVARHLEPGLLAYVDDEPVGWCAVAPRRRYERLANPRARTYRAIDERESWVVTCFFVRRDQRRQGVAEALLTAVGSFVAERDGSLVEGYPVEQVDQGAATLYTGTTGMFERAGFDEGARPGGRPLVRLEVRRR
jgi:GNAT superfamily N-acetyltransferase